MKEIKKIIKITKVAIVSAVTAATVAYATTDYLLKIAMNRKTPKTTKVISEHLSGKSEIDETFLKVVQRDAKKLIEQENEKVEIVASDGTKLIGHWCPVDHPKRIIIAMHGWKSTWYKDFGMISDFWKENGCNVLYAEQRGTGESAGDYIGFGITERFDCRDWANFIDERNEMNLPIYLVGISMGATTVLMASDLNLPSNVHGIMADCAFTSPDEIWKHVAENNLHLMVGLKGEIANSIYQKKITISDDKFSTVDALKKCKVPVLFVHGTDDHFVPVEMTYKNYKACNTSKKLLIVPGADHGMSYYLEKENYENAVLDFWNQNDKFLNNENYQ